MLVKHNGGIYLRYYLQGFSLYVAPPKGESEVIYYKKAMLC